MITLTTDFGLADPYVAEMKGVILKINHKAVIIDVTHQVADFNVREAAFILASAAFYFPERTVHVAVVDPGVGTERRAIAIKTKQAFYVGPDNGILLLAAQNQGIQRIHQLTNSKFMLPQVSDTFHGRDVFAPAAAYLDKGVDPAQFGPEIKNPVTPNFVHANFSCNVYEGEILHVDGFGNIITNITGKELPTEKRKNVQVNLGSGELTFPYVKTYGEAKGKKPVCLVGSHGFLEIALNQSSAAKKFGVKVGDEVRVTFA